MLIFWCVLFTFLEQFHININSVILAAGLNLKTSEILFTPVNSKFRAMHSTDYVSGLVSNFPDFSDCITIRIYSSIT